MKAPPPFAGLVRQVLWRLLSFPIYFKIMGIGMLTAFIFGGFTLYQVRSYSSAIHYPLLEQRNMSIASSLASHFEQLILTSNWFEIHQMLKQEKNIYPDIRYIIVADPNGKVLTHTFDGAVPGDLLEDSAGKVPLGGRTHVWKSNVGLIIECIAPIAEGNIGFVRVGASDENMEKEISSLDRAVYIALGTSAIIGLTLALLLTALIARPLQQLNFATEEIRAGRYGVHALISSNDEIGKFTRVFNEMSDGLEKGRIQIQEKEASRLRLVQKAISAQEEERKRISRELHDDLGQSLSALLLSIQSAAQQAAPPTGKTFSDFEERTRTMLGTVRRLAWDLRPSILDDYGLSTALSRYIEDTSRQFGVRMDFQCSGLPDEKRLPDQIEITLFRIAQEAISNILQHSGAQQTSVVLIGQENAVTLLIEDDGRGFDINNIRQDGVKHLGLLGMKERAALIDGRFTLESNPGKGTVVKIEIPLKGGEG